MLDRFDLGRFVEAQRPVYPAVLAELANGRKTSHWMWFVFPQIAGLGNSAMARHFAIASREEAVSYLDHAVLGPRLRHCTDLVNGIGGRTVGAIFGQPDDLKFRSSMTLFAEVAQDKRVFLRALDRYFGGGVDEATLARL